MRWTAALIVVALLACQTTAPPPPPKPATDDAALEAKARQLLANFNAGRFDAVAKEFNAGLSSTLPASELSAVAKQLGPQLGAFREVTAVQHSTEQGRHMVTLVSRYENTMANVQVIFDSEGKVAGLFFRPPSAP